MKLRRYRGYGYGDVTISKEEWQHIYGQLFNTVTAWIDYAGGYKFPLDGTFSMDRLNAAIAIVWANVPTDPEVEAYRAEAEAMGWGMNAAEYTMIKKLGFLDPAITDAWEAVTGIPATEIMAMALRGEDPTPLITTRFPMFASEEAFEAYAASQPPPPGRTGDFQPPKEKGKVPWYGYVAMIGGGALVGGIAGFLVGRR